MMFDQTLGSPREGPPRARGKSQPRLGEAKRGPRATSNCQEELADGDDSFEGIRLLVHAV